MSKRAAVSVLFAALAWVVAGCSFERLTFVAKDAGMLGDDGREDVAPPPADRTCGAMVCGEGQYCAPGDGGAGVCNVCPSVAQTRCMNGCADLRTSPLNCGACGNACSAERHQQMSCAEGVCACATGWADCDGNAANGCETNLGTDVGHCGRCQNRCAGSMNATATCREGVCGRACNLGYADCDGSAANGCEAVLDSNPAHCGMCGQSCAALHVTGACGGGQCTGPCAMGWGNCNTNRADGCERPLTDVMNCGACGRVCPTNHNSPVCTNGMCAVGTCEPGYGDCDFGIGNGCEAAFNLVTSCGRCGVVCATGQQCRPNVWSGPNECCLPERGVCSRDADCCGAMRCVMALCTSVPVDGGCAHSQDCTTMNCVANQRGDGGVCASRDGGLP